MCVCSYFGVAGDAAECFCLGMRCDYFFLILVCVWGCCCLVFMVLFVRMGCVFCIFSVTGVMLPNDFFFIHVFLISSLIHLVLFSRDGLSVLFIFFGWWSNEAEWFCLYMRLL